MRWTTGTALVITLAMLWVPAASATAPAKAISLVAKEFSFTPKTVTLKVGQHAVLRLTNQGTMDHEFLSTLFKAAKDVEVKAEGVRVEADEVEEVEFEPGKTVTIELTPTKPGTYTFWCAEVTNGKLHRDLGMKGMIKVTR